MFEIKLLEKFPSKKAEFWSQIPEEIHVVFIEEKPVSGFYLFYDENRLTLGWNEAELAGFRPFFLDWKEQLSQFRHTLRSVKDEVLYKSLAMAKEASPVVADATLGTGKDALLMLAL